MIVLVVGLHLGTFRVVALSDYFFQVYFFILSNGLLVMFPQSSVKNCRSIANQDPFNDIHLTMFNDDLGGGVGPEGHISFL